MAGGDIAHARSCTLWVHGNEINTDVLFNPVHLPSAKEGDVIELLRQTGSAAADNAGLLFHVPSGGKEHKKTLQISVSDGVAQAFSLENREQIILSKLPSPLPTQYLATHCEIYFRDSYVGRADLHRLTAQLIGTCAWVGQRLTLPGCSFKARLADLSVGSTKRRSAVITEDTQIVFRSHSAKLYLFLQVSSESWQFDTDGSLFFEKAVGLFLPELFSRWAARGTNHIACIVLFSRILYNDDELPDMTRGETLPRDVQGRAYRDVYKVVCDFEPHHFWLSVLQQLKEDFATYQKDLLLDLRPRADGKLAGRIAAAHEGNVLEAINLCISSFDKHYMDRDLARTGLSCIVITAGTCQFVVDQNLLRLTRERMRDHGICLDCVSLAKVPLHQVPVFQYDGYEPVASELPSSTETSASKPDAAHEGRDVRSLVLSRALQTLDEAVESARSAPDVPVIDTPASTRRFARLADPLEYDGPPAGETATKRTFYYIPPDWMEASFYSRQPDRPFRVDRFMPRCVMTKVQSLGLVEYDNATISVPPLASEMTMEMANGSEVMDPRLKRQLEREYFDIAACGGKAAALPSPLQSARPSGSTMPSSGGASDIEGVDADTPLRSPETAMPSRVPSPTPAPAKPSRPPSVLEARGRPPRSSRASSPSRPSLPAVNRSSSIASTTRSVSGATTQTVARKSFTPALISRIAAQAKATPTIPVSNVEVPSRPATWTSFFRGTVGHARTPSSSQVTPRAIEPVASKGTTPDYMSVPSQTLASSILPTIPATPSSTTQPIAIRSRVNGEPQTTSSMQQLIATSYSSSAAGVTPPNVTFPVKPMVPSHDSSGSLPEAAKTKKSLPQRVYANPSNPQEGAKRVGNAREPRPPDHAIHWKSLCTPAVLPLTSTWFPSPKEFSRDYTEATYTLPVLLDQPAVLLRHSDTLEEAGCKLMRELVYQRLQQNFQLVPPSTLKAMGYSEAQGGYDGRSVAVLDKASVRGKIYYLTMATHIHSLRYSNAAQEIEVSIFVRKQPFSKDPVKYRFSLWPRYGKHFEDVEVNFVYPTLDLFDWTRVDRVVCGLESRLRSAVKYWRARFVLLPAPIPNKKLIISALVDELDEASNDEEIRLAGMLKMFGIFESARWQPTSSVPFNNPGVTYTFSDMLPSAFVRDEISAQSGVQISRNAHQGRSATLASKSTLEEIAAAMRQEDGGLNFVDRRWQLRKYYDTFLGHELVDWLVSHYADINTRQDALDLGNSLQKQGLFHHVHTGGITANEGRRLLDAYTFYVLSHEYSRPDRPSRNWFGRDIRFTAPRSRASSPDGATSGRNGAAVDRIEDGDRRSIKSSGHSQTNPDKNRMVFTRTTVIDLDRTGRSDRAETAWLHYDAHFSYATAYHFQFEWLSTSRVIEEQVAAISRLADRYGLRFVETLMGQIADAPEKSPLEKPITVRFAVPPPNDEWQSDLFLALASRFDYVLDQEPDYRFPADADMKYTYRKTPTTGFQFMHASGVAFIQVSVEHDALLFLHNRLLIGHLEPGTKSGRPLPSALLADLRKFCSDAKALESFWRTTTEELVAKQEEMSRRAASEGLRTPQSGVIGTLPSFMPVT